MPNPNYIKAVRTFEDSSLASLYQDGLYAGIKYAQQTGGSTYPEPIMSVLERDPIEGYIVYIRQGYYGDGGEIIWP